MSNSSASPEAQLRVVISELQGLQVQARMDYASLAFLLYELLLTFSAEVQHIWRRGKTLVFYLFLGLRYSALLCFLLNAAADFLQNASTQGCTAMDFAADVCEFVVGACICGIFTLRVYATWNRNQYVLLGLTPLACGRFVTALWDDFSQSISVADDFSRQWITCPASYGRYTPSLSSANAAFVLCFDTAVLLLTVTQTTQQVWMCHKLKLGRNLSYFILRDGILYFLSIEIWLAAGIMTTYLPAPFVAEAIINRLEQIIAIVLCQRLVLNLRHVDEELHLPSLPSFKVGELSFAHGPVLGNIGAPLRDASDEQAELEAEPDEELGEENTGTHMEGSQEVIELDDLAIEEVPRSV